METWGIGSESHSSAQTWLFFTPPVLWVWNSSKTTWFFQSHTHQPHPFPWPSQNSSAHQSAHQTGSCLSTRAWLISTGRVKENSVTKANRKIHLNKRDCCGKGEVNCCGHYMILIFCLYQLPPPSSLTWEVAKSVTQKAARHKECYLEGLCFISKSLQAYSTCSCICEEYYTKNRDQFLGLRSTSLEELYIKAQKKQFHRWAHQLYNYPAGSSSASSASTVFIFSLCKNFLYTYAYFSMHFLFIIAVYFMLLAFALTCLWPFCYLKKTNELQTPQKETLAEGLKEKHLFKEERKVPHMQSSVVTNTLND